MDRGVGGAGLSFIERPLPPAFEMRTVSIAPGCALAYDALAWRDALVVVERGEIEIECMHGTRRRFAHGDVLWLIGLPLRALHNRGREAVVLVAVARR
jgi:quercetin dioxygenase-like cupin family protein